MKNFPMDLSPRFLIKRVNAVALLFLPIHLIGRKNQLENANSKFNNIIYILVLIFLNIPVYHIKLQNIPNELVIFFK